VSAHDHSTVASSAEARLHQTRGRDFFVNVDFVKHVALVAEFDESGKGSRESHRANDAVKN
jgi:hypothetical protein